MSKTNYNPNNIQVANGQLVNTVNTSGLKFPAFDYEYLGISPEELAMWKSNPLTAFKGKTWENATKNYPQFLKEYLEKYGRIKDPELASLLFKEYLENPTLQNAKDIQQLSELIANQATDLRLASKTAPYTSYLIGQPGAGKNTLAYAGYNNIFKNSDVIDFIHPSYLGNEDVLQQLAYGAKNSDVNFVLRNAQDAMNAVKQRKFQPLPMGMDERAWTQNGINELLEAIQQYNLKNPNNMINYRVYENTPKGFLGKGGGGLPNEMDLINNNLWKILESNKRFGL